MPQVIDITEIINRNPKVNVDELVAINEVLERLSKLGIKPEQYNLRSPFSQQQHFKKQEAPRRASPLRFKRQ